uniref:F-box domain-containing protein n=1 Tax=Caenorhabditis tropicalis TaxID=1561998 RepID=A0A1I7UGR3_9PELO
MSRQLSYQSFKAIIQYMDPNDRIKVSQCCPAFHRVDKIVPLRLECLRLNDNKTTINNCTYRKWEPKFSDRSRHLESLDDMLDDLQILQENLTGNTERETNPKYKTMIQLYSRDRNMDAKKIFGLILAIFDSKLREFYRKEIEQLPIRWQYTVDHDGAYYVN